MTIVTKVVTIDRRPQRLGISRRTVQKDEYCNNTMFSSLASTPASSVTSMPATDASVTKNDPSSKTAKLPAADVTSGTSQFLPGSDANNTSSPSRGFEATSSIRVAHRIGVILALVVFMMVSSFYSINRQHLKLKSRGELENVTELSLLQDRKECHKFSTKPLFENPFHVQEANISYLQDMKMHNLTLSYRQQLKYFAVKDEIFDWVKETPEVRHMWRGDGNRGRNHAYIVNEKYAFRHILKNGGTTMELQTRSKHVPLWGLADRHIMVAVRDPIDHFLSGWGECGMRNPDVMVQPNRTYDERIREWLRWIKKPRSCPRKDYVCSRCVKHSYPQANSFVSTNLKRLDLVGDLRELDKLLGLIGFRYDASKGVGRNATESVVKVDHFPKRIDLLSNSTLIDLCRYLAFDYYLLDFEPPEPCRGLPFLEKWSKPPSDVNANVCST